MIRVVLRSFSVPLVRNSLRQKLPLIQIVQFSRLPRRKSGSGRTGRSGDKDDELAPPPPTAVTDPSLAWTEVRDPATSQVYWWNTITNETTSLGAPKPTGPTAMSTISSQQSISPQQGGGMLSGLGGVMAQGFAFGAGSSIAHNVIGNMFGGGSSSSADSGGDAGGGDSWDV